MFLNTESNKIFSSLTKIVMLVVCLCLFAESMQGQDHNDEVIVTTVDHQKLLGKIVEDNETYIKLLLNSIMDTVKIDRVIIKNINTSKNEIETEDIARKQSEVIVTTLDNSSYVGTIVGDDGRQLRLALKGINDTISIDYQIIKNNVTHRIRYKPNQNQTFDETYVVISMINKSKFVGTIVNENKDEITLALINVKDHIILRKENIDWMNIQRTKNRYKKTVPKNKFETITYKNGSIFHGESISQNDSEIIFILDAWGDTLTLQKKLIANYYDKNNAFMFRGGRYHKKRGYVNALSYHQSTVNEHSVQVQYLGYNLIRPKYGVGGGVGYHSITGSRATFEFADIFAYGKYFVTNSWARLYVDAKLGVAMPLSSSYQTSASTGPKFQPGVGVEFARRKRGRLSINVSQLLQYSELEKQVYDVDANFHIKKFFSRTTFGVSWIISG